MPDPTVQEAARQLLRALAAQVKPIMREHGFVVNSLEEYEYNSVFAGRNWNHGETIELVLRSSTGSLLSAHWLMNTLCHELAHIKHGNHGPAFQALWRQLQQEVRALQNRGYYGDGYWSSGTKLLDSTKVAGQGIELGELPEYMCGGAHSRARPATGRQRKSQSEPKRRKAGSRVSSTSFTTTGKALNEDLEGQNKFHGVGFKKRAGSKRAREERALAAEQRIRVFQSKESCSNTSIPSVVGDSSDLENDVQEAESDHDRHRILLEVVEERDLDALKTSALMHEKRFLLAATRSSSEIGDTRPCDESVDSGAHVYPWGSGRTSLSDTTSVRPSKKRKVSQSRLHLEALGKEDPWDCMVCTLSNEPNHLACSACATTRGETKWVDVNGRGSVQ